MPDHFSEKVLFDAVRPPHPAEDAFVHTLFVGTGGTNLSGWSRNPEKSKFDCCLEC